MKNDLKITLAAALMVLVAPLAAVAAIPNYLRNAISVPRGVTGGWAFSPTETPTSYRQAALLVRDPKNTTDSRSGLFYVDNRGSSINLSAYEKYSEAVGAVKGDLDGDGLADALVWFRSRPYFKVYFGDKPLRNQVVRVYEDTLRLGSPDTLALADLNGDNLPEIIAWYGSLNYIQIQWQDSVPPGADRFRRFDLYLLPGANSAALSAYSPRLIFGDFNADGKTDFVFHNCLFKAEGQGRFTILPYQTQAGIGFTLGSFDLDGDGLDELIAASNNATYTPDVAHVMNLDAKNIFQDKTTFSINFQGATYADCFDYNADGNPDLLFGGGPTVTMLRGIAPGKYASGAADTVVAGSRGLQLIGATDWGNDGILDWLFLSAKSDSLVIYSPADARYVDNTANVGLDRTLAGNAVAVGDYNNDGLLDIYVLNYKSYSALFQGQPGGRFVDVAEQAGVAQVNDGISCAWGDYDNDGYKDLVIAGISLPSKLFHNNGNGTFSDSTRILGLDQSGRQRATSVCWGDVNRDGWLDLLVGNYDGANWLLVSQSGRKFLDRSRDFGLTESNKTESATLVDVDADGWLDMVTLNDEGPIRLLMGGDKGFTDATANSGLNVGSTYAKFGQSQSWGDFNGDGYPDLYITRAQDVDALYMNVGKGSGARFDRKFSDYVDGRYGRLASAIADLDEDCRPDLLIARTSVFGFFSGSYGDLFFSNPGQYPNPGAGTKSTDDAGLRRAADSSLPVPADYDGDGDLDVLYVNYLPDNPSDLFHGSQLPLGYSENKGLFQRNLVLRLKRDKRSLIGTRAVLFVGGKGWLQTVPGGGGRIQNNGTLLWSISQNGYADSLVVYWPQKGRQTLAGPLLPGTVEISEDTQSGPTLKLLPSADGTPVTGTITSTSRTVDVTLEARDPSGVKWVRVVFGDSSATRQDTVYGQPLGNDQWKITRRTPLPGNSQRFFFEAADTFGNQSRDPAGGTYSLYNTATGFRGDINRDNKVDINDLVLLLDWLKASSPPLSEAEKALADLNQDGKVDFIDVIILGQLASR
ncbi:FG-GAP-like repeat-containing protein [bacterium]|nr:FG-GAP-like repeat-containing protein [bacterium]